MIDPNKLYTANEIEKIIGCEPHDHVVTHWLHNKLIRVEEPGEWYGFNKYLGRDVIKCMSHRRKWKPFLKENGIEVPAEEEYLDGKIKDAEKQLSILEEEFEEKKKSLQLTENKIASMEKKIRELKNQK